MKKNEKKEHGDYQTPIEYTDKICEFILKQNKKLSISIIEPTFGEGNFIKSAMNILSPKKVFGVEIKKEYFDNVVESLKDRGKYLFNENIFDFDFEKIKSKLSSSENILIIGNPPWITNSELSNISSDNLPIKTNFKKHIGLDAITGNSNFDITEYIILKLLTEFKEYKTSIAMLCKTIVVKNILKDIDKYEFKLSNMKIYLIDSKKIFNVSADACLFTAEISNENTRICEVYNFDNQNKLLYSFGWEKDKFYSRLGEVNKIDGQSCFEWRQGIKHDCSKVMELSKVDNEYVNGDKLKITMENEYIYPLLKSSHIKRPIILDTCKHVIVTQKKIKEDTSIIKEKAPKTWEYLNVNKQKLDSRKSSIYNNCPAFSMFGIGDYSFSKYKVGISGFYKEPFFTLAYSDKAIMFDDTCYFIGFEDYKNAFITMLILNSESVQYFLKSIAFIDNKRPYTKEILRRIDFSNCTKILKYENLIDTANKIGIENVDITKEDYNMYCNSIEIKNKERINT